MFGFPWCVAISAHLRAILRCCPLAVGRGRKYYIACRYAHAHSHEYTDASACLYACAWNQVCSVRIELEHAGGTTVLKPKTPLLAGEVIDASVLRTQALREFYEQQLQSVPDGVLFSLHLKACSESETSGSGPKQIRLINSPPA